MNIWCNCSDTNYKVTTLLWQDGRQVEYYHYHNERRGKMASPTDFIRSPYNSAALPHSLW